MKRTFRFTWLLAALVIGDCVASNSGTKEIPTHTPNPTLTAAPHATETALPRATVQTIQSASASPVTYSSSLNADQVKIDAGVSYQQIDGFGATHISLDYQGMGSTISPELRAKAIDAVYHQVGINLGNLEGGLLESPGSYEQRANDNNDPNEFNWNGFQTFWADAAHSDILTLAQPDGFTGYYINEKVNIRWSSPWLGELRTSDYPRYLDEAAEQVAATSVYWRDKYGIVPRYVMLFNEPFGGNGELQSQQGDVKEVVDLVKAAGSRLEREGFSDVRFILPNDETIGQSLDIAKAVLSDPQARKFIGVIGYHSYPYGSPYTSIPHVLSTSGAGTPDPDALAAREQLRQLSQQYNVPVWMTEVSHGEVNPTSYDDFRGRAIHIHDEFVYANASAYFGMNNMWDTTSQQEHFGNASLFDNSSEGTIALIDNNQQKIYVTGMGYAIGHYARWIKPGSIRVDALTGDPLVQVTAFKSPDPSHLIVVLINNHPDAKIVHIDVSAATLTGDVSGEQSTPMQYWAPLNNFQFSSPEAFQINLPGQSVTTVDLALQKN